MLKRVIPQPTETPASQESKFRAILLIAGRARQIQAGAKPSVHTIARKATRIAREEFSAGLIPYEILPAAEQ
jgi:DNA-directed RNA polymerase subunit K/omega